MNSIAVALITGGMALLGTVLSNYMANNKTLYRIEQLEKKQELHNHVIERLYVVEKAIDIMDERQRVTNHRIDDLERGSEWDGRERRSSN